MSEIEDKDAYVDDADPGQSKVEAAIDVDDLTQLPDVDLKRERRLKRIGYDTLYEIAEASIQGLAQDARVTTKVAQNMITVAKLLLKQIKTHMD